MTTIDEHYLTRPPEIDALVRFNWDIGYGEIHSVFLANEESLKAYHDKEVYFGEVAGKHSEVYGHLNAMDFYVVSRKPELLDMLYELADERNHLFGMDIQDQLAEALNPENEE